MRNYVRNLAGESNADDILQDVSWQIFRQIRHLREPKVVRAWAFRIATRISFHYLKRVHETNRHSREWAYATV